MCQLFSFSPYATKFSMYMNVLCARTEHIVTCQQAQASKASVDQSVSKHAMQSDGNPQEASAPCSLWRMLPATSAAKPASESLQASSTACSSTLAAPSMSFASSAAKPAEGQLHSVTVA